MARQLWAPIDVGTPQHPKLFGRSLVTRFLWLCLICRAKERHGDDGVIRGLDAACLAGLYNLGPVEGVQEALNYFQSIGWIQVEGNGDIALISFAKHNKLYGVDIDRDKWRDKKRKQRGTLKGQAKDNPVNTEETKQGTEKGTCLSNVPSVPAIEEEEEIRTPLTPLEAVRGHVPLGSRAWDRLRKAGKAQSQSPTDQRPAWVKAGCSSAEEYTAWLARTRELLAAERPGHRLDDKGWEAEFSAFRERWANKPQTPEASHA